MKQYKIIEVEQGSKEWLDFRANKIGASEIASILEVDGAYKTRKQLLFEKRTNHTEEVSEFTKKLFQDGHDYEPIIRDSVKSVIGDHQPIVIQSNEHEHLIASLDGFNQDKNTVLEIKTTRSESVLNAVLSGSIPDVYKVQLNFQMGLIGSQCGYIAVMDVSTEKVSIMRHEFDDELFKKSVEAANLFYQEMQLPAPSTEIAESDLAKVQQIAASRQTIKELQKLIDAREQEIKDFAETLLSKYSADKLEGGGIIFERITRQGTIDYSKIDELKKIDLEKYRKKPTTFIQVKEQKQKKEKETTNERLNDSK